MTLNYVYRIGVTAWRRKTTVVVVTALLLVVTAVLNYNRNDFSLNQLNILKDSDKSNYRSLKHNNEGVKFVESSNVRINSDNKESITVLDAEAIGKLEQPSRDDIAARLQVDDDPSMIKEIENQLGIPYVGLDTKSPYVPKQRLVHFDLKGAPPKVSYLRRVFPLIKTMGATGILLGK